MFAKHIKNNKLPIPAMTSTFLGELAPWMNMESGSLSIHTPKIHDKSAMVEMERICIMLINITLSNIVGPPIVTYFK